MPVASIDPIAWTCIALLGFLVPALGFNVSLKRGKAQSAYHYNPDPADPLYKAIRLHGNTCEYVPALMVLTLTTNWVAAGQVALWLAILVTLSRYLYVVGIALSESLDKIHPLRVAGSAGTYFLGMGQALYLVYAALT